MKLWLSALVAVLNGQLEKAAVHLDGENKKLSASLLRHLEAALAEAVSLEKSFSDLPAPPVAPPSPEPPPHMRMDTDPVAE